MAVSGSAIVTKQERVYQAIRERILSGAYGPGYRVVIDALAEEFDRVHRISPSPPSPESVLDSLVEGVEANGDPCEIVWSNQTFVQRFAESRGAIGYYSHFKAATAGKRHHSYKI